MKDDLLKIKNLRASFRISGEYYAAVDGVNLEVKKNEVFAIVGESGSGKSAMAMSIMQLHNMNYTRLEGEVIYKGEDLLKLTPSQMNKVRGKEISMIFQDPLSALNPLMTIGVQIEESMYYHLNMNAAERKERTLELLNDVKMVNPKLTYEQYPHELSGGMRQRVIIALAMASRPSLIIADEPTTALDVTIQAQILDLMRVMQSETGVSIIIITHDLGVVAEMADWVAVMYAGQIVEYSSVYEIFKNPQHPYTRSLLKAIPSLDSHNDKLHAIEGSVPDLRNLPRTGCRFSPRIPWISDDEHEEQPEIRNIGSEEQEHWVLCSCYKTFRFED